MNFLKFMVHTLFGLQCPKDFCDFAVINRLAQAGGGGPYYMIFHYQKVSVLNYFYGRFIYFQDQSAYSAAGNMWTDPGNI